MIIRDIFWGLALWGLITLILPPGIYHGLLVTLGVLTLIGLCVFLSWLFFDWLRVRFDR